MMAGLDGMTELARQRMAEGTAASGRRVQCTCAGRNPGGAETAREASGQFRELARHVAALSASELAAKIAAARDLTAELAERERGLGDQIGTEESPARPVGNGGRTGQAGAERHGA